MKILLIGHEGYLGVEAARILAENGHSVTGWGRKDDILKISREFLHSFEAIINFSAAMDRAEGRLKLESLDYRVNVDGVRHLAEQITGTATKWIQISTKDIFGDVYRGKPVQETSTQLIPPFKVSECHPFRPLTPYAVSKLMGEWIAFSHPYTNIIRLSTCYTDKFHARGNWIMNFAKMALNHKVPLFQGSGKQVRDPLHIEDLMSLIETMLKSDRWGVAVNAGGGERNFLSVLEVARFFFPNESIPSQGVGDFGFVFDNSLAWDLFQWTPRILFQDRAKRITHNIKESLSRTGSLPAVILSAGKSSRLASLGLNIPKPMIKVEGKPILQHHVETCVRHMITDIFVNLHYLPDVIQNYFSQGEQFGAKIHYRYETELLGTGGAINNFSADLAAYPEVLIIYGDNLWDYPLDQILSEHRKTNADFSIVVFEKPDVTQSGVVEFNDQNRILRFIEKPRSADSESHWVNAGIYIVKQELIKRIPEGFSDFGKDLIPQWLYEGVHFQAIPMKTPVTAVDTPEMLQTAQRPLMILDRDGVINSMVFEPNHGLVDSPLHPDQVSIEPETISALKDLMELGFRFAIASNQPASAKGKTTAANLQAVHEKILKSLSSAGIPIESSHICFHRSEDDCNCRKPKPQLLIDAMTLNGAAAKTTWMIGDGVTDIAAAHAAGVKAVFIGSQKNELHLAFEKLGVEPHFWGSNWRDVVDWFARKKSNI